MKSFFLVALLASVTMAGCSTSSPLIPAKSIQLTSKTAVSTTTLATGAAVLGIVYLVYDPLAPNWEIEESRLSEDTYRMSMKMKRYHTGGAGESMQVFKRRATQLITEQGYGRYEILEYSEGIESQTLGARRTAEGVVRLVEQRQADSFMLNGRN